MDRSNGALGRLKCALDMTGKPSVGFRQGGSQTLHVLLIKPGYEINIRGGSNVAVGNDSPGPNSEVVNCMAIQRFEYSRWIESHSSLALPTSSAANAQRAKACWIRSPASSANSVSECMMVTSSE